jgi:hypothetical protein
MMVLRDTACHATAGDPANLTQCQRGAWQDRLLVETVLSMVTLVSHFTKGMHRVWTYVQARLAFTMAACHVLVQWHGVRPTRYDFVPLSIAKWSLQETHTMALLREPLAPLCGRAVFIGPAVYGVGWVGGFGPVPASRTPP